MRDGTRQYFQQDSIYCQSTVGNECEIAMTVPEGTERLWMIVSPAPKKYFQHKWDEKYDANDDSWPYQVAFEGTDIDDSRATIYAPAILDGRQISDATFTYDVQLPVRNDYQAVPVTVGGSAAALLGTAFQLQPTDIASKMTAYTTAGPKADEVMFYPVNPKTMAIVNRNSTANGYGHWFNASGNVSDYASGYVYSEFTPSSFTFNIGQFPSRVKVGDAYTIAQALVYNDGKDQAIATFLFRIRITNGEAGAQLVEKTNGIEGIQNSNFKNQNEDEMVNGKCFDLSGKRILSPPSTLHSPQIFIQAGKKTVGR
jgi:hypothetical protein